MRSKILDYLLRPALEMCEDHIVVFDGLEYIPADSFGEVLSELVFLLAEVMNQIKIISFVSVFCFALALSGALIFVKAIYYHRKDKDAVAQ